MLLLLPYMKKVLKLLVEDLSLGGEKMKRTGEARVNRFALIVIAIIGILMLFGYTAKCLQGGLSVTYTVVFDVLVILSLVADLIAQKLWISKFKIIAFLGYAVVYAVAVFFAETPLTFVIAYPISVVFILYYDQKIIIAMSALFSTINIIDLALQILVLKQMHGGAPLEFSGLLLQFLTIVVYFVSLCSVTKISNQNNEENLNRVKSMADRVTDGIEEINQQIISLNESSVSMKNSMDEVNSGITDTSNAVQNQLYQTEAIQNRIEQVQGETKLMSENVAQTMEAVVSGTTEMLELVKSSEASVEISAEVTEKLGGLRESMAEMNQITKLIDSIAFQTNIMALNANVEAARAGEAGRGFAVVASEISNMSDKTKEATERIDDIIVGVTTSLNELVDSIDEMAGNISAGKERTDATAVVFRQIEQSTNEMKEHVEQLLGNIVNLTEANREIVASVQTISATSEEVSALASEALDIETSNSSALQQVAELVADLAT